MAGSDSVEVEKQTAIAETPQSPPPSSTIVTTDGQHAEAIAGVTGHLVDAGFKDQTAKTVAPQASADAVLAEIKKQTPKANPVGAIVHRVGRVVTNFVGGITGTKYEYLVEPDSGIHLTPIKRIVQASRWGVISAITNSFFRLMGKKKD